MFGGFVRSIISWNEFTYQSDTMSLAANFLLTRKPEYYYLRSTFSRYYLGLYYIIPMQCDFNLAAYT
jgi:hypothetical protein